MWPGVCTLCIFPSNYTEWYSPPPPYMHIQWCAALCRSKASEGGKAALGCRPTEHPREPSPADEDFLAIHDEHAVAQDRWAGGEGPRSCDSVAVGIGFHDCHCCGDDVSTFFLPLSVGYQQQMSTISSVSAPAKATPFLGKMPTVPSFPSAPSASTATRRIFSDSDKPATLRQLSLYNKQTGRNQAVRTELKPDLWKAVYLGVKRQLSQQVNHLLLGIPFPVFKLPSGLLCQVEMDQDQVGMHYGCI